MSTQKMDTAVDELEALLDYLEPGSYPKEVVSLIKTTRNVIRIYDDEFNGEMAVDK